MARTYSNITGYGKRLSNDTKRTLALQSLSKQNSISDLSRTYGCSLTRVHLQKITALLAITKAFDIDNENTLLYDLPITKNYIKQVVISLFLICKSSFRDIIFFLKDIFDYSISLGSIYTILDEEAEKAETINQSYDLSSMKISTADELFHRNKPHLAVVDIPSRFCPLLVKADKRDYETWGIHLLDLMNKGYAPKTTVIDGAKGLLKGHEEVLPDTKIRYDHFHMLKDMADCRRFLKNKTLSSTTCVLNLLARVENAKDLESKKHLVQASREAYSKYIIHEETYNSFALLVQWMQHDVLQLAGHPPKGRAYLYDFIVTEMACIAAKHPHRITEIVTSLKARREALLDVCNTLNTRFLEVSNKHNVSLEIVWQICYETRYALDNPKYVAKAWELQSLIGDKYEEIEDEVLMILEETPRCSSMVENFNSRLRPYLDERKEVTQKRLTLIQFYLNHKPFMRSHHFSLKNKTPAEAMTGETHENWLTLLGHTQFKRKAA